MVGRTLPLFSFKVGDILVKNVASSAVPPGITNYYSDGPIRIQKGNSKGSRSGSDLPNPSSGLGALPYLASLGCIHPCGLQKNCCNLRAIIAESKNIIYEEG